MDKTTLLYIADPMCSWCYGFAPELDAVRTHLGDTAAFHMVMGGLRPFNTETMAKIGGMLRQHWKHVAQRSGQPFNHEILADDAFVYDTEPPCRAVVTMRHLNPAIEYPFFKVIQAAFYAANQNTNDIKTYSILAHQFGVGTAVFEQAYQSDEMRQATLADFQFAADLGVRGFPTTVLHHNDDYHLLANGYTTAAQIIAAIEPLLAA